MRCARLSHCRHHDAIMTTPLPSPVGVTTSTSVVICGKRFKMSQIDLFRLYVLSPQCRSRNNTLENSFIQMLSYSHADVCIIHEETKGATSLQTLKNWENKTYKLKRSISQWKDRSYGYSKSHSMISCEIVLEIVSRSPRKACLQAIILTKN